MRRVMVRYKVKADKAAGNVAYVKKVFEQLKRDQPSGLRYASFKQADGVSFVYVVSLETPDTHVQDVVGLLEAKELENVVLAGHSYADLVISGVATRARRRPARCVDEAGRLYARAPGGKPAQPRCFLKNSSVLSRASFEASAL